MKQKKYLKTIALFVSVIFTVLLIPIKTSAQTIPDQRLLPRLVDNADLLNDSEEAKLLDKLDLISEKYQTDVAIVTVYSLEGKTAAEYADDFFDDNGYGIGPNHDGVLFLISTESRDWFITTNGSGIQTFTDAGRAHMTEQFLSYISDAKYAKGFNKFADLSEQYLKQAAKGEPYDYGNLPKKPLAWYWLPASIGVGLIVAFVIAGSMKAKLKSVRRRVGADDYVAANSFVLTDQRDLYLYSHVSRTVKPKESSSGGGGSSGGSRTRTSSSGSTHGGSGGKF
ncbi:MAG: TPM domain-containing protein [Clostridiaceae bacterium]|nr:TPM domain-containing protein [Clostridiaceae bacterium]